MCIVKHKERDLPEMQDVYNTSLLAKEFPR